MQLRGIGPTTAGALLATIGAGHDFRNGRQVAAWIGLTPGQYSSGGKARLGSITKAGDAYLRGLLVNGARAVIASLGEKQDHFSRWVRTLVERRGYWRAAAIAIAAKNARLAWASLKYGDDFKLEPVAANFDSSLSINRQRDTSADVVSTQKRSLCTASGDVKRLDPQALIP
jgi:transposase